MFAQQNTNQACAEWSCAAYETALRRTDVTCANEGALQCEQSFSNTRDRATVGARGRSGCPLQLTCKDTWRVTDVPAQGVRGKTSIELESGRMIHGSTTYSPADPRIHLKDEGRQRQSTKRTTRKVKDQGCQVLEPALPHIEEGILPEEIQKRIASYQTKGKSTHLVDRPFQTPSPSLSHP